MRVAIAMVVLAIVCFCFKDTLFGVILAPKESSFITYQWFNSAAKALFSAPTTMEEFSVSLINTQLAQQFMIHMKMAFYTAFLLLFPYLLFEVFAFIKPALYSTERKYTGTVLSVSYIMFLMGMAISYFLIFPLTFRFLGTYQVSAEVINTITLESYISTFMMLNLMMGVVFEIPIVCWLLAKLGIINAAFLKRYLKHAIIAILILAAVITPTSDIFTLLLVSAPMCLLSEAGILLVRITKANDNKPTPAST